MSALGEISTQLTFFIRSVEIGPQRFLCDFSEQFTLSGVVNSAWTQWPPNECERENDITRNLMLL